MIIREVWALNNLSLYSLSVTLRVFPLCNSAVKFGISYITIARPCIQNIL
jgi:hypothetical protein